MSGLDAIAVATLLRHRPPARLIAAETDGEPGRRRFVTEARETWHWALLLEAAAQAAGLCVRSEAAGAAKFTGSLLVAAFERVIQLAEPRTGLHTLTVAHVRSFLAMHQFDVTVEGAGVQVLAARVTLASEDSP